MILTRRAKNAFQNTTAVTAGQVPVQRKELCFVKKIFRHDCQDGSDENDCNFSNIKVNKKFM